MKTRTSAGNRGGGMKKSTGPGRSRGATPDARGKKRPQTAGGRPAKAAQRTQDAAPRRDRDRLAAPRGSARPAPPANERAAPRVVPAQPAPPAAPKVEIVAVAEDREGQRLDNFLAGRLKGVPKSLVYRICRTGEVRVNGRRAKPDQRLAAGDEVRIPPVRVAERSPDAPPPDTQLERIEAAIIHEDRDFLVIDKPAGIASHGGSGISFGAIELLRAARPRDTLELVHRLDRDTSGVLVLARKRSALTALQTEIREGRVEKRYLALIESALPQARLLVDAPLRKSVLQGGERMVRVDDEGKPSRSRFSEVERYADASLVEVALETGRTHQIRVHAQHIGHALAGDEKYGDRTFNKTMRERGLKRLFLHAARFQFEIGERSYAFSAPLAPELAGVLDTLKGGRK